MAGRQDELKTEIDRTRRQLAQDLADLKVQSAAAERSAVKVGAAGAGGFVLYRVGRFVWNRVRPRSRERSRLEALRALLDQLSV